MSHDLRSVFEPYASPPRPRKQGVVPLRRWLVTMPGYLPVTVEAVTKSEARAKARDQAGLHSTPSGTRCSILEEDA